MSPVGAPSGEQMCSSQVGLQSSINNQTESGGDKEYGIHSSVCGYPFHFRKETTTKEAYIWRIKTPDAAGVSLGASLCLTKKENLPFQKMRLNALARRELLQEKR